MAAAEAMATDISVSCTSEYPDYTYNEKHDIWTLVSLTAPCQAEDDEEKEEKVPMDIVAVMDKSGSMAGEKLELVKRTLEFVLTQLTDKDRLALVTYDTNVYVDFGLMNMTKDNKKAASSKIQNIRDGSSTNLCGGLLRGLCEIINRPEGNRNDVASVLLFTDGLANQGIQNVDGIIAAMKNPKKFCGPSAPPSHRDNAQQPAPHTSWLKNVFSRGGSVKESKPKSEAFPTSSSSTANDATVYTFGFGQDHDAIMLKKISDAGNGMYYFIETEDKIGESFAHCLGGLASTVAQGIQLEVTMATGVTIKEVHSTRPHEESGENSIKVNIGDLQAEESRDVVLELSIDTVGAPYDTTPQDLFNVEVDYFNVNSSNLESVVGSLGVLRPATATVHDETNVNARVTQERSRVNMTQAIKDAGVRARRGSYGSTQNLLMERIEDLKLCKQNLAGNATREEGMLDVYDAMIDDLEDYRSNATDATAWNTKGQHQEMYMGQEYACQRSTIPEAKNFQSKAKKKAVKSFKLF